jgi:hypothetical protein
MWGIPAGSGERGDLTPNAVIKACVGYLKMRYTHALTRAASPKKARMMERMIKRYDVQKSADSKLKVERSGTQPVCDEGEQRNAAKVVFESRCLIYRLHIVASWYGNQEMQGSPNLDRQQDTQGQVTQNEVCL